MYVADEFRLQIAVSPRLPLIREASGTGRNETKRNEYQFASRIESSRVELDSEAKRPVGCRVEPLSKDPYSEEQRS